MGSFISRVLAIILAAALLVVVFGGGCLGCFGLITAERERTNQQVVAPPAAPPQHIASAPAAHGGQATEQKDSESGTASPRGDPPPTIGQIPSPGESPPDEEWADSRNALRQRDLEVKITEATVSFVPLEDFSNRSGKSKERLLMIRLEITNTSSSRKVDYRGRGAPFADVLSRASLRDEKGNHYKRCDFGFANRVVGQVRDAESIYPGKSLSDVLVFERPVDGFATLLFELPANAFGGSGKLRFKIASGSVVDDPKADEEASQQEDFDRRRAEIVEEINERNSEFKRRLDTAKAIGASPEVFSRIEREIADYKRDVDQRLAKLPKSEAEKAAGEAKQRDAERAAHDKMEREFAAAREAADRRDAEQEAKYRTWTTADGKHTVEAKLLSAINGKIKLKKRDGTMITIDKALLSPDDLKWLKEKASSHGF